MKVGSKTTSEVHFIDVQVCVRVRVCAYFVTSFIRFLFLFFVVRRVFLSVRSGCGVFFSFFFCFAIWFGGEQVCWDERRDRYD